MVRSVADGGNRPLPYYCLPVENVCTIIHHLERCRQGDAYDVLELVGIGGEQHPNLADN